MYSRKLYRWAESGKQIQQSTAATSAARHDWLFDFGLQFLKVLSFGTRNGEKSVTAGRIFSNESRVDSLTPDLSLFSNPRIIPSPSAGYATLV